MIKQTKRYCHHTTRSISQFVRFQVLTAASIFRAITLMMKAAGTSETSVNFYQTTRRNNPEDSHLPFPVCAKIRYWRGLK
jgi:hypothetical protein